MLNPQLHRLIIELVITWTLVLVFIFTAIVTCLSLVGLVRIDPRVRKKLYAVIIIDVAVIAVGVFGGFLEPDPKVAASAARTEAVAETLTALPPNSPLPPTLSPPIEVKPSEQKWVVFIGDWDDIDRANMRRSQTAELCKLTDTEIFQQGSRYFMRIYFPTEEAAKAGAECLKNHKISRTPSTPRISSRSKGA